MRNRGVRLAVVAVMLLVQWGMAIELELSAENSLEVCMTLISSFDVRMLAYSADQRRTEVPSCLQQTASGILRHQTSQGDHSHGPEIRRNGGQLYLPILLRPRKQYPFSYSDVPYNLCVTFNAIRGMDSIKPLYVGYSAIEDF